MSKKGRPAGSKKEDTKEGIVRFRCDMRHKSRWVKLAQKQQTTLSKWIISRLNSD